MADKELEDILKLCTTKSFICADNVLKYLENDKEKEIQKLRSHVKHYCLYEKYPNVIEQVAEKIKNELDASNVDGIEDTFKMYLNRMLSDETDVNNHPWMVELDKRIGQGNSIAGNLDMIDSLTKKPIQNPVRNKHCGHIYEKESILNHINLRKKALCPVVGCGNKQPLRQKDLSSEIDIRSHITQQSTSNEVPYDVDMDSE